MSDSILDNSEPTTSTANLLLRRLSDSDPKKWEKTRHKAVQALLSGDNEAFDMIINTCPEQLRKSLYDAAVKIVNDRDAKIAPTLHEQKTEIVPELRDSTDKTHYQPLHHSASNIQARHEEPAIQPAYLLRLR